MQCTQCGATVVATARFCPICGHPFASDHTAQPTPINIAGYDSTATPAATIHDAATLVMQRRGSTATATPAETLSAADVAALVAGVGKSMVVSQWQRWWWKILIIGIVVYIAVNNVTFSTYNVFLLPQLFIIGTFLVPIVYTAYLYEDGTLYDVALSKIALVFFFGGVLGCLAASLLEHRFIGTDQAGLFGSLSLGNALIVAFSEELAKLIVVLPFLAVARRHYPTVMHGIVLGAAAGMGFAAFESMGYAFYALIASGGGIEQSIARMHDVIVLRALLAPLGHGTWTAIIAATLWRERLNGRFPLTINVLIAFVGASLLHVLWNWLPPLSLPVIGLPLMLLILGAIGLLILRFFLLIARGNTGGAFAEPNLLRALQRYFVALPDELSAKVRGGRA
jgi:protease PrsW